MAQGLGEWSYTARFRDAVTRLVLNLLNDHRPPPRYGEVRSIDQINNSCTVRFLGGAQDGSEDVPIAMASVQPSRAGQIVRVEGLLGDRYIDDVLGESVVAGGIPIGMMFEWGGITIPSWAARADGSLLQVSDYPALFSEYGYRHGGSGNQFALPTVSSVNQNVITLVRVR